MKTLLDAINIRLSHAVCAALAICLIVSAPSAQPAVTQQSSDDRIALYQALLDLANPWTVMCVAAHPDDEDGTSLIVMRRKYGAHTVSLFSTFGEGGQNAIGPELYEELGAIRARETAAASEIQGSEPYFLGLTDFGFSKSRDEAFQKWGHEEALRRMVLQIRKLRPDVIITNHSTTSNDHGHHQATARLVVEAFDAAADQTKFPEQLKDGVTTWQVQRLFVRQRGAQAPPADAQLVTIDPNERDPVRGTLFAEQALSGLQKHATQGPWPKTFAEFTARFRAVTGQGGATGQMPLIRYRLERQARSAAPGANSSPNSPRDYSLPLDDGLPKNSNNFLDGLRLPDDLARHLAPPTINGKPLSQSLEERDGLIKELVEYDTRLHRTQVLPVRVMRPIWATREALAAASGISARLISDRPTAEPRSNISAQLVMSNNGVSQVRVGPVSSWLSDFNGEVKVLAKVAFNENTVPARQTRTFQLSQEVPSTATVTVPHSEHLYDNAWRGFVMAVVMNFDVNGTHFSLNRAAQVDVAPYLEIEEVNPSPVVVTRPVVGASSAGVDILPAVPPKVTVKLINHLPRPFRGELAFGQENRSPETRQKIELAAQESRTLTVSIPVKENSRATNGSPSHLADNLWLALRNLGSHENLIKRKVPVVWADAKVNRKVSVGYVRGFDFSLPNALNALGVESKELSVDEVKTSDLSKFTSVIVDNRVYESQPELIAANQKLLDYAQAGGNLIVFYHKNDEWNPNPQRNRPQLSPYKLILGNERITDENAPITFIEPDHPLLNSPNKLNQDDFKDWIQERGLYYPREWDPQFKALLQSNDPNEQPLKGGLLVADYGKGHYIYTSMVWYRQLRAGVPGAYRMLANMISYGSEGKR